MDELAAALGIKKRSSSPWTPSQTPFRLRTSIYRRRQASVSWIRFQTPKHRRELARADALNDAIERLGDRESIYWRCAHGKTQMEVAAEVGISQAQVSRLEKNAINQIKKNL